MQLKLHKFLHNCHTWIAEISPHDNFSPTKIIGDIRDKYELCVLVATVSEACVPKVSVLVASVPVASVSGASVPKGLETHKHTNI